MFLYLNDVWGDDFHKKFQNLEKKISFNFITFNFFIGYYCSINIKRQSEHSGLRLIRAVLFTFIDADRNTHFYSIFIHGIPVQAIS